MQGIRAGLALALQRSVGVDNIVSRERALLDRVLSAWRRHPHIILMGSDRPAFWTQFTDVGGRPEIGDAAALLATPVATPAPARALAGRRLPIVSFNVRMGALVNRSAVAAHELRPGVHEFLHQNFVAQLLNDIYGIQARSGCSCTGPYGHRLFHATPEVSVALREDVKLGAAGVKPGAARGLA